MAKKENGLTTGTPEPENVDKYFSELVHPLADTAQLLRTIILGVDEKVGEGIYWNAPTFYYTGPMEPFPPKEYRRYIAGFNFYKQDALRLIFLRGAEVENTGGLLTGDFKDGRRLATFSSIDEVKKHEADVKNIVKQLMQKMK